MRNEPNAECRMRKAEWPGRTSSRAAGLWGSTLSCNSAFRIPHSALVLHSPFRIPHSARWGAGRLWQLRCPRVTVTIPPGATLDAAVDSLAANHVIAHPGSFRLYARLRGLAGSLKSGVYLDRKSTRLNSRHRYISDAVFCLEKKKRVIEQQQASR